MALGIAPVAVVIHRVEASGGRIAVASGAGGGAVFRIELSLTAAASYHAGKR